MQKEKKGTTAKTKSAKVKSSCTLRRPSNENPALISSSFVDKTPAAGSKNFASADSTTEKKNGLKVTKPQKATIGARKSSVVVDLTQKESKDYDFQKPTKKVFKSNTASHKSFEKELDNQARSPPVGQVKRRPESVMLLEQQNSAQNDDGATLKKKWVQLSGQGDCRTIVQGGVNLAEINSASTVQQRRGMKQDDQTTTLRKPDNQQQILHYHLDVNLDQTQAVYSQALEIALNNPAGLPLEPSPIRKFNEEELVSYDRLRRQQLESNNKGQQALQIFTPEQRDRLDSSGGNHQKLLSSQDLTTQTRKLDHQSSQKKIRESREHDDQVMALSPYKTSPNHQKFAHNTVQSLWSLPHVNHGSLANDPTAEYKYISGEEDVPMTDSMRKRPLRIQEHRFNIRQTQFNFISSLMAAGTDYIYEAPSLQIRNESLLQKASQRGPNNRYSPVKFNGNIEDDDSRRDSTRGLNLSPVRQNFFCCAPSSQSIASLQNSNKPPSRLQQIRSSRNAQQQLALELFNADSFKTDDCCILEDDVDECGDELLLSSSRPPSFKQLIINSLVISPGSRITAQGLKWSSKCLSGETSIVQQDAIKNWKAHSVTSAEPKKQDGLRGERAGDDPSLVILNEEEEDEQENESDFQHYEQVISALCAIKRSIVAPRIEEIDPALFVELPLFNAAHKTKTIIFDMDETLVHCVEDIERDKPDIVVEIQFPDEEEPVEAGFNIRPFLYECLKEANKEFQVGVFTASHKAYADAVLDHIDPTNELFQFRFYREHCIKTPQGYYVKDLRIFKNSRALSDLVLIDNSVYSFAFQIENGVPIIPFYRDKNDEELFHLITYLQGVKAVEDVRMYNREAFHLLELCEEQYHKDTNRSYQDDENVVESVGSNEELSSSL